MSQKTAYLISCSDHYGHRLHVADSCLKACGYDTTYITSDFDHTAKTVFTCKVPGCVQLHARPYQKNLSLDRILNHREFARDVFRYLEKLPQQPDVVVALVPPNFLAHYGAKYKKRHPNVKLVFDIFDLWPETFPGGKVKKLLAPAFAVWAAIRDRNLGTADYVVTECEMFRQKLKLSERSKAIWLCQEPLNIQKEAPRLAEDKLVLCYLGAINNVISIPDICGLLRELAARKKVVLHIIGKGERQQEFVEEATAAGAEVIFHGPIYDEAEKLAIMNQCHFGLNIMKASVCVGLTMKSVDYFRFGLPIINNIPADTQQLVGEQGIGVQLEPGCAEKLLAMTNEECGQMRARVESVFDGCFAENVVLEQYGQVFRQLGCAGSDTSNHSGGNHEEDC